VPVGLGSDSHRLAAGRKLVLGGVAIPESPHGPVAHSDGDALLHALADALLSAAGAGDIGALFPDTDPENAGIDSAVIVAAAMVRVREQGLSVDNASLVVVIDQPRIAPHRAAIEERVAGLLGIDAGRVGLTCKTSEGQSPGHVNALAAVLLLRT
jgi:2-C-methyl-D-erythritol 2,4-cyclodiphosphate synthase